MNFTDAIPKIFQRKKIISKRVTIIIILLLFIPIIYNLQSVYSNTLEIIQKEKINDITNLLDKQSITIEFFIKEISRGLNKEGSNPAIRRVIQEYSKLNQLQLRGSIEFFRGEFSKISIESNLKDIFCINQDKNIIHYNKEYQEIYGQIAKSSWYEDFYQGTLMESWNFVELEGEEGKSNKYIVALYRLKGIKNDVILNDLDVDIGSLVYIIDPKVINSICDSSSDALHKFSLYNGKKMLFGDGISEKIMDEHNLIDLNQQNKQNTILFQNNGEDMLAVSQKIDIANWQLVGVASLNEYAMPLKNALKNSLWLIFLVAILATIWILIETILVTKLINEKHISEFRLMAVEEANQRFRIYKHDIMNHFQIIQGLIQMGNYEKAFEYSISLSNEGRLLASRSDIGIPELESAIFLALSGIEDKGIEVNFDFITLPKNLPFKVYDLVKIIVNLMKNAIYALDSSKAENKLLTIRIYEGIGEYIFEVINNVPIIDEDIRNRIFAKGFTTKGEDGNGLGLYIVKKLAEKNIGTVELVVDEEGNHFVVRLPN